MSMPGTKKYLLRSISYSNHSYFVTLKSKLSDNQVYTDMTLYHLQILVRLAVWGFFKLLQIIRVMNIHIAIIKVFPCHSPDKCVIGRTGCTMNAP